MLTHTIFVQQRWHLGRNRAATGKKGGGVGMGEKEKKCPTLPYEKLQFRF